MSHTRPHPLPPHTPLIFWRTVQIVPKEEALREPVGSGRSEPNRHPYLPKPTGRISLSFLHPFSSCYQLLGAKLLKKVLLASLIVSVFSIGYYIIPNILGNLSTH